ncbi:MAG: alpha/beta fold hydrolase [Chloroflexi bacterium]|nr:alpha/beta fold hydrolase [Chloroflexota bacterium]
MPTSISTPHATSQRRPTGRARALLRRAGRVLLGLTIALVALGGNGLVDRAAAAVGDRRAYPPPGRLVDVGGFRLHLLEMGREHGGPAVVLEAGLVSFSPNWHWVQTELAATTRVVAYDRAGLGWSDPSPRPRDVRTIAAELHAALRAASVAPPYLLAGHSFGGLPARAFADRYPDEVAGLVLADASHPDQWARWPTPPADLLLAAARQVTSWLAWFGLLRLVDPSAAISAGLPPRQVGELRAHRPAQRGGDGARPAAGLASGEPGAGQRRARWTREMDLLPSDQKAGGSSPSEGIPRRTK